MNERPTPYEALLQAVQSAGSQSELARICGVSQNSVWKWVQSGKRLPAEYVLAVEGATGIDRNHLRPDIYPLGLQEGRPFSPAERTVGEGASIDPFNRGAVLNQEEQAA